MDEGTWVLIGIGVACLAIGGALLGRARAPVESAAPGDPIGGERRFGLDPRNPYAATPDGDAPGIPSWRSVRSREKWTAVVALGFVAASVAVFALAIDPDVIVRRPAIFLSAAVAMCVGLTVVWEEPGLPRMRSIARAAIASRGIPLEYLTDDRYVGIGRTPAGVREGSEAVGFVLLAADELTLHATDGDLRIPRGRVTRVRRVRIPGDTLALAGARCVEVSWLDAGGEEQSRCLLGRAGETSFAIKRASEELARRIDAWA